MTTAWGGPYFLSQRTQVHEATPPSRGCMQASGDTRSLSSLLEGIPAGRGGMELLLGRIEGSTDRVHPPWV